jgi:hypothetical protein
MQWIGYRPPVSLCFIVPQLLLVRKGKINRFLKGRSFSCAVANPLVCHPEEGFKPDEGSVLRVFQ